MLAALGLVTCLCALLSLARVRERSGAVPRGAPETEPAPIAASEVSGPLDLNRASAAELERLPRIGPALAARIVAHRPFASVADLQRVPGIGPRTVARLEPLVTAGEPERDGVDP